MGHGFFLGTRPFVLHPHPIQWVFAAYQRIRFHNIDDFGALSIPSSRSLRSFVYSCLHLAGDDRRGSSSVHVFGIGRR